MPTLQATDYYYAIKSTRPRSQSTRIEDWLGGRRGLPCFSVSAAALFSPRYRRQSLNQVCSRLALREIRLTRSSHEIAYLLRSEGPILVCVHRFEDALVSRLKFLQ
jgi:hypothetical protein